MSGFELDANVFGANFHLAQCQIWAEAGSRAIARVFELPEHPPRLRVERLGSAYLAIVALHQALAAGHWVRLNDPSTGPLAPAELDEANFRRRIARLRDVAVHQSESIEDDDLVLDADGSGYVLVRMTDGSATPAGPELPYTHVAQILADPELWVALHSHGRPMADRPHVSPDPKRRPRRRKV